MDKEKITIKDKLMSKMFAPKTPRELFVAMEEVRTSKHFNDERYGELISLLLDSKDIKYINRALQIFWCGECKPFSNESLNEKYNSIRYVNMVNRIVETKDAGYLCKYLEMYEPPYIYNNGKSVGFKNCCNIIKVVVKTKDINYIGNILETYEKHLLKKYDKHNQVLPDLYVYEFYKDIAKTCDVDFINEIAKLNVVKKHNCDYFKVVDKYNTNKLDINLSNKNNDNENLMYE